MGVRVTAPNRGQSLIEKSGSPTLRVAKFFEGISDTIADLPDVATAVADLNMGSSIPEAIAIENKINELLGALRTSGVLAT